VRAGPVSAFLIFSCKWSIKSIENIILIKVRI
jgi:hypothetical protein